MAIKRVDEQFIEKEREQGRPEVLGVFRKGAPKGEKSIGKDLEYFRFTSDSPDVVELVEKIFTAKPQEITGMVPFDKIEKWWSYWMEKWTKTKFWHRCDGIRCVMMRDPKTDRVESYHNTPYEQRPACPGGCKQIGRLTLIVPELVTETLRLGTVGIMTTSIHDICRIQENIEYLKENWGQRDEASLKGMSVVVRRRPKSIGIPVGNEGARGQKVSWLLSIGPSKEFIEEQLRRDKRTALAEGQEQRTLPAASIDITDFQEVSQEEEDEIGNNPPDVEAEFSMRPDPSVAAPKVEKPARQKGATTAKAALETPDVKGKRLALISGAVRKMPDGYWLVSEDGDHEYRVTKNGKIHCDRLWADGNAADCDALRNGRADDPEFACGHIVAVKEFVRMSREADEKAAAQEAR